MAIKQTVWSLEDGKELPLSTQLTEKELEDLIAQHINFLSSDWLVVGQQVRTIYGGIIDILCIDIAGNPIVIELKKNMTPREVTAQALDYASWVKSIDADDLAQIYLDYNHDKKSLSEAYKEAFGLELVANSDETEVKIIIVATKIDNSTERIINYLKSYGIDINVTVFSVFEHENKILLSRAWLFEEEAVVKTTENQKGNWNGEYYVSFGECDNRSWEDAMKYGFICGGGGSWYSKTLYNLEVGSRIWVNIPGEGYVGVGIVTETACFAKDAIFDYNNTETAFFELPLTADYHKTAPKDNQEHIVKIDWIKKFPKDKAVSEYGFFGIQHTVSMPKSEKWGFTIRRLKELWGI